MGFGEGLDGRVFGAAVGKGRDGKGRRGGDWGMGRWGRGRGKGEECEMAGFSGMMSRRMMMMNETAVC